MSNFMCLMFPTLCLFKTFFSPLLQVNVIISLELFTLLFIWKKVVYTFSPSQDIYYTLMEIDNIDSSSLTITLNKYRCPMMTEERNVI